MTVVVDSEEAAKDKGTSENGKIADNFIVLSECMESDKVRRNL